MVQRLQQLLNAHETQYEVPFALLVVAAEIKAGAEVAAFALEHQQARAIAMRRGNGAKQRVDQFGVERIGLVGPVEGESCEGAALRHDQAAHRASSAAALISAERSQKLGRTLL